MSVMRNELQPMLIAAKELPVGELPRLLGELEEIRVTALARLTVPQPAPQQSDGLRDIAEAGLRYFLGVVNEMRVEMREHPPPQEFWESMRRRLPKLEQEWLKLGEIQKSGRETA